MTSHFMILDGKGLAKEMLENLGKEVAGMGKITLAAVAYEEDQESIVYFNSIKKNAEKIGINFVINVIKGSDLMETIWKLNEDRTVSSFIIGRPFPKGITNDMVSEAIDPDKDADCVSPYNLGQLNFGVERIAPATARAAIDLLAYHKIDLRGKAALVINRSVTVGRPLAQMLLNRDATVTVAHSKTLDMGRLIEESDIIFLAVGRPSYLKSSFLKGKHVVVDIGINVVDGKVRGDFEADVESETDYTPVPGGVGTVTSVEILRNAVELARSQ
ncbi:MAG: bifunctional 5,10-methylenetetrahydrofolate dehydrogenase/5,10-methenyltetrahydrofolate cyclohydrolase [Thermoplasmata archaeon]